MSAHGALLARYVFLDYLGSILWFPVWWYTKGLMLMVEKTRRSLNYRIKSYSFAIWLKNFFVPMYGQYDITGRFVSVFMRFVILLARIVALASEALVYLLGLFAWIVALPFLVLMILRSFGLRF
ncbi:hypothetical protein KKF59_02215 [Patescibacteria group bacterium]|nr:hypothetical protein [Patescibacteria group bacterium]MBU1035035.1 hypothetical protein [Patescibacteria group bacterium]MBU1629763.1 hypothetical protein [Patescibacteria group bacterium]MBU1907925.1 hypothetical protein [Patescibacteria group bacterium]